MHSCLYCMCACVFGGVLRVHKPVWDTAAYHRYLNSSGVSHGKKGHESSLKKKKLGSNTFTEFFPCCLKKSIAVSTHRFRDRLSTHLKRIWIFQGLKRLWGLLVYVMLSIKENQNIYDPRESEVSLVIKEQNTVGSPGVVLTTYIS